MCARMRIRSVHIKHICVLPEVIIFMLTYSKMGLLHSAFLEVWTCADLCDHHHNQMLNTSITPEDFLALLLYNQNNSPVPVPWQPLTCSVWTVSSFPECYVHEIMQWVDFWAWLLCLCMIPLGTLMVLLVSVVHPDSLLRSIPLPSCPAVSYSTRCWKAFGLFLFFCGYEWSCYKHPQTGFSVVRFHLSRANTWV